ncbi:MAG: hypothetical protein HY320_01195 [Armatimonadetes bacterium]|nr:hypothetical protein [Armatimonadota bacterium]
MPFTSGFDPARLADHFAKHSGDFGAKTAAEYEAMADAFLGGPLPTDAIQATRVGGGDLVRYNPVTNEFGVLAKSGVIRSYFKPDPKVHGLPSNPDYFHAECKK